MTIAISNRVINFDKWLRMLVLTTLMLGTMQLVFDCDNNAMTDAEADAGWAEIDDLPQVDMPEDYAQRLNDSVQDAIRKLRDED